MVEELEFVETLVKLFVVDVHKVEDDGEEVAIDEEGDEEDDGHPLVTT